MFRRLRQERVTAFYQQIIRFWCAILAVKQMLEKPATLYSIIKVKVLQQLV